MALCWSVGVGAKRLSNCAFVAKLERQGWVENSEETWGRGWFHRDAECVCMQPINQETSATTDPLRAIVASRRGTKLTRQARICGWATLWQVLRAVITTPKATSAHSDVVGRSFQIGVEAWPDAETSRIRQGQKHTTYVKASTGANCRTEDRSRGNASRSWISRLREHGCPE